MLKRAMSTSLKIYTRTGDKGTSTLYTGQRIPKDSVRFEALGTTDELSSHLGLSREFVLSIPDQSGLVKRLEKIQCLLQDIGSNIATDKSGSQFKVNKTRFDEGGFLVGELEQWIDGYCDQLPPLKNFILASGGKSSSSLHIARTVCRRAERRVTPLVIDEAVDASVLHYLNRLSDFLFAASRWCASVEGVDEVVYTSASIQKGEGEVKTNK